MAKKEMLIEIPKGFYLDKAVCNHGFFMMAPNTWDPSTRTLTRPLRLPNHDDPSLTASIQQLNAYFLRVTLLLNSKPDLSTDDRHFIRSQVERMLHISEEDERVVKEFHKVNPRAKETGFARIFRSPTLSEDIVKSILLTNSTWCKTLVMAEALCVCQHKLVCCGGSGKKRKRCQCRERKGNFPSAKEIVSLGLKSLQQCKVGYRAKHILNLAKDIEKGSLRLEDIANAPPHQIYSRLMGIGGCGSFVAANVMMCIGFYEYVPTDSETTKHLEQVHGKNNLKDKKPEAQAQDITEIYDKFKPYQCLTYWMERVEYYEKHLGKLSLLPASSYRNVSSTAIHQHAPDQKFSPN